MRATDDRTKSLKFSFYDGIFASVMIGLTQEYFAPFLLLLKATAAHIGMLSALPNFFASLVQLGSADLTERLKSRKAIINIFVLLQAMMLLPMVIIALMGNMRPFVFIMAVILFVSFGALAMPAWGSLMSDLVREDKRGSYFGWRNKTLGFIIVGASFIAGFILNMMKRINIFYGFMLIFSLAFLCRLISWYFLTRMYEPTIEYRKENYFSLMDFISNLKRSNFAKFVLFTSMMSFSVNLASPFFVVLMLRDLHFSYLLYTSITVTATFTVYLMINRWGVFADRIGNLKIIKFTSPLIGFIPLLWVINRNPVFLFFAQVFSGFMWAGFNICTTNFTYDAVSPEKRTRCIAYFNVFNGLAICGGALCGGFLLRHLPAIFGYKILTLFLISSIARIAVAVLMPLRLKEVRPVEEISHNELFFSILGIKPLLGVERKTIRY